MTPTTQMNGERLGRLKGCLPVHTLILALFFARAECWPAFRGWTLELNRSTLLDWGPKRIGRAFMWLETADVCRLLIACRQNPIAPLAAHIWCGLKIWKAQPIYACRSIYKFWSYISRSYKRKFCSRNTFHTPLSIALSLWNLCAAPAPTFKCIERCTPHKHAMAIEHGFPHHTC